MAIPLLEPHPSVVDLRAAIHSILNPSPRAKQVIDAMLLRRGGIGAAGQVARALGFRDRFAFAAWFVREGLPPLHELAGWIRVLNWLDQVERTGVSLCAGALHDGRDPAACYRLVQRITGKSWGEIRNVGLAGLLARFAARCRVLRHRWMRPHRLGVFATVRPQTTTAARIPQSVIARDASTPMLCQSDAPNNSSPVER